jgi:hypothetical protein
MCITGTDNRPRLEWRATNAMTRWWRQSRSAYVSNYEIRHIWSCNSFGHEMASTCVSDNHLGIESALGSFAQAVTLASYR